MEYALKERIGKPELFIGRNKEMIFFLKWIDDIKNEKSQSTAILARRKMGKTAIMERLFNITFYKNDGVIPFYYEIKETKMWVVDFCKDFFLTFIYQYIAFKTRKSEYLNPQSRSDFGRVVEIAKQEGLAHLCDIIEDAANAVAHEEIGILWNITREAPKTIAARWNEFIVQMIDEFQFLNAMIYRDKEMKNPADDLAGGYLSTAESKIAPLLVSGSWVGWLMKELSSMLPARFKYKFLTSMPENEATEMLYKYSEFFEVPVTEETAYLLINFTEGSPFYISAVFRSNYPDIDLTTIDGLSRTLEYETLKDGGTIKSTWMEYITSAFSRVNDQNAKNIVLHLSKYKDREWTRKELLEILNLDMTDGELEKKLKALVKADIISQGRTNFDYRGVGDNIFDKVFRGVYEKEIREFDPKIIREEYIEAFEKLKKDFYTLLGKYNYQKGYYAEYAKRFNVDIFARAQSPGDYSIIGEVKSRDLRKFSKDEVSEFERKLAEVKKIEGIERAVGFIFSRSGFTPEAEEYCKERGIAISEDEKWLG